jgi:hypothetical protein
MDGSSADVSKNQSRYAPQRTSMHRAAAHLRHRFWPVTGTRLYVRVTITSRRGTPRPSTTTIHFVPLPRLVFPTPQPPFLAGAETAVQKRFAPFQLLALV